MFLCWYHQVKKKRNFVFRLLKIKGSDMLFFVITGQGPICWLLCSATNKCAWFSLAYLCSYIIQFRILRISGSSMSLRRVFYFIFSAYCVPGTGTTRDKEDTVVFTLKEVRRGKEACPCNCWNAGVCREQQEPKGRQVCLKIGRGRQALTEEGEFELRLKEWVGVCQEDMRRGYF